jgi:hypothetical protein
MYHYVRDTHLTPFPLIRACHPKVFREQLLYLLKIGTPISGEDLIQAVKFDGELPPNAFLLSFDDGYSDCYTNVFPILEEFGIRSIFFPSGYAVERSKVLDVNKIQFVLAAQQDISRLLKCVTRWISERQTELPTIDELRSRSRIFSHLDNQEVMLFKFILQRGLPRAAREELSSHLFEQFVTADESAFSEELYLSKAQIRTMFEAGQSFGSHGYTHEWFDLLSENELRSEIANSLRFLSSCGVSDKEWIMCYPFGCNPFPSPLVILRRLLPEYGCIMAFTDDRAITDLEVGDRFYTKRIDTNDVYNYQSW